MRYAVEGFPNVSEEIFERRMLICNSCELLKRQNSSCSVCVCAVEYKGRMKTESCPKNKWLHGYSTRINKKSNSYSWR